MASLKNYIFSSLGQHGTSKIASMPELTDKNIVMGYWHNWPSKPGDGYQGGIFADMHLTDIPKEYNIIAAAFMKGSGIPTFQPYHYNDEEFHDQVAALNAQGRAVLISLGGADAQIKLYQGQENALATEIIRLVETYGFNGIDLDLEHSAITASDNITVIPDALKLVKDYYRTLGINFIISMAPQFPYLRPNDPYSSYIRQLRDYYDFIAPQYYNQGGDGVWVDEINAWFSQNNDERKEDFLYYLTDSLVHGTRGYLQIPSDKLLIGLPANRDAAGNGYVINPDNLKQAVRRLEANDSPIKGIMSCSINWDFGEDHKGTPYNREFIRQYGSLFDNDTASEKTDDSDGVIPSDRF